MRARRRIRQVFEVVLLGIACVTIPVFPRFLVVRLSRVLGALAYSFCPKMRRIAIANVSLALGADLSESERLAIARGSFQSFALLVLDLFWFAYFTERRVKRMVKFDTSFDAFFSTQPLVVMTGHLGNWEVLGLALALRGAPCLSVAAPLLNPFADRFLNSVRRRTGQRIASQRGAIRMLLKELKSGGRTALLLDQNTLPRDGGEFVDFFGLPVPMSKAAAALVEHSKAPVMFVYCLADRRGYYTAYALPKLDAAGEGMKGTEITRAVAGMIEKAVAKDPAQWLWMYRRWNYIPDEHDRSGYPFYARKVSEPRVRF